MEITWTEGAATMTVQRSAGTSLAYDSFSGPVRDESHFWFLLRNRLNGKVAWGRQDRATRWVKRVPAKDGHLTSAPYYLRERRQRDGHLYSLVDGRYAIRNVARDYNAGEPIVLDVTNHA